MQARRVPRRSSRTGATAKVCLVYLAPDKGDLTAVSFRPTQEDAPITWTGELKKPKPTKKAKGKKNKNGTRQVASAGDQVAVRMDDE